MDGAAGHACGQPAQTRPGGAGVSRSRALMHTLAPPHKKKLSLTPQCTHYHYPPAPHLPQHVLADGAQRRVHRVDRVVRGAGEAVFWGGGGDQGVSTGGGGGSHVWGAERGTVRAPPGESVAHCVGGAADGVAHRLRRAGCGVGHGAACSALQVRRLGGGQVSRTGGASAASSALRLPATALARPHSQPTPSLLQYSGR